MDSLRLKAKELLESKSVDIVIGYEEGTKGVARPVFITNPENSAKIIYDERCIQNLAVYLTKAEVRKQGKMAIVATLPVMRSIMTLLSEKQITPDDFVVLGISDKNELLDIADIDEIGRAHV